MMTVACVALAVVCTFLWLSVKRDPPMNSLIISRGPYTGISVGDLICTLALISFFLWLSFKRDPR